jgi:hypothetical protein
LQRDTVAAVIWEMPEPEALSFSQLLHSSTDIIAQKRLHRRPQHQQPQQERTFQ